MRGKGEEEEEELDLKLEPRWAAFSPSLSLLPANERVLQCQSTAPPARSSERGEGKTPLKRSFRLRGGGGGPPN